MSTPVNKSEYYKDPSPSPLLPSDEEVKKSQTIGQRAIRSPFLQSPDPSTTSSISPYPLAQSPMPILFTPQSPIEQLEDALIMEKDNLALYWAERVDLHERTSLGETALICAAKYGSTNVVEKLLNRKAPVHVVADNGNNALMESAKRNYAAIVRLLCNAGAPLTTKNRQERTAEDLAQDFYHKNKHLYSNGKANPVLSWGLLRAVKKFSQKPEILYGQKGVEVERRKMVKSDYSPGFTMSIFRDEKTGQVLRTYTHLKQEAYSEGSYKACKPLLESSHILDFAPEMVRLVMRDPRPDLPGLDHLLYSVYHNIAALELLTNSPCIAQIDTVVIAKNNKKKRTINFYQTKYDGDLKQTIKQSLESDYPTPLSIDEKLQITDDILSGITAIHAQNIAHRDIKPENILIRKTQTGYHAAIHDFDLCMLPEVRHTNLYQGTQSFIPPEIKNAHAQGKEFSKEDLLKADVWATGRTLKKLWRDAQQQIHPKISRFIDAMCAQNPNERPAGNVLYRYFQELKLDFREPSETLPPLPAAIHTNPGRDSHSDLAINDSQRDSIPAADVDSIYPHDDVYDPDDYEAAAAERAYGDSE